MLFDVVIAGVVEVLCVGVLVVGFFSPNPEAKLTPKGLNSSEPPTLLLFSRELRLRLLLKPKLSSLLLTNPKGALSPN